MAVEKIDTKDQARIDKCFALALSDAIPDGERINAIKTADKVVNKHGLSIAEYYQNILRSPPSTGEKNDVSHVIDLERKVDRLQQQLEQASEEIDALRLAALEKPHLSEGAPIHLPVDGAYTYDAFYSALLSHLGTPKRALSVFSELTGASGGKVQSWRRANKVPVEAFEAIAKIDRGKAVFNNHQPLTEEQKRRIDRLSIEGNTDEQIANTMNLEFGDRVFNINMIKGAKTQIRTSFLDDLVFDGKSREDTKAAFLARYPAARTIDKMLDKAFGKK
jgi:hypothetical protein